MIRIIVQHLVRLICQLLFYGVVPLVEGRLGPGIGYRFLCVVPLGAAAVVRGVFLVEQRCGIGIEAGCV